ncbi:MAG TPA: D-alanyl-D-alanine carboxypeptidase family protein [Anaerovoracaceae bacterium]|nr:D-alanyl-D-alanine carboxypeptidase family protein [Anaerovoracaceae bacterium]
MLNEKKIKSIIVIALLLIETFVWTVNNPNMPWSLGIIGGPDGPGAIIGSNDEPIKDNGGEENQPGGEQPGQNNEGQSGQGPDGQSGQDEEEQPGQNGLEGYPPAGDEEREQALLEAEDKGLLILVNKGNPVDRDYKPDDLTAVKYYAPDRAEATRYLRAEAAEAFHQLVEAAAGEGLEFRMTTAYRSYDFQKILFDSYVAKEGEAKANTYSARPGQSEHQTGLSVDVSSPVVDWQLSNDYGNTEEGKWLADNAYRFGFILRFPKGKEDITGYQYEPWHLRYVGLAAAKEIYEYDLTLEEFLVYNGIE